VLNSDFIVEESVDSRVYTLLGLEGLVTAFADDTGWETGSFMGYSVNRAVFQVGGVTTLD
jgi:hypothetical protein